MKKLLLFTLLLIVAISSQAQVKFSLSLLSDQETYLVSILPEKDIPQPLNMATNIQVVLKIPEGEPFLAGNIQSQIAGIDWIDNAFAKQSSLGENYGLCAFMMVQSATKDISMVAGVELPLFTFKNLEPGCVGALSLPDNGDDEVVKALGQKFNFTQNITLLGKRGNAFSGIENKITNCNQLSTNVENLPITKNLIAYPVPAREKLTIEWQNPENFQRLILELLGSNGQLLQTIELDPNIGTKKVQLNVQSYPNGLYNFLIKNDKGDYQQHKFIKVGYR